MPFKANAARRHHIPKQRRRVTNWAEYDAALRQRGSLTVWFTEEAVAAWHAEPRTTPGGQPHYSDLAITTALTLKAVFRLALRQTEGLIGSIIRLLGLALSVPDHTTLSRRAGSVRARASQYRLTWNEANPGSCGLQDGQHGHTPPEKEESLAVGGNVLVGAGARAEKVAQFIVSATEPG